ncbi:MAG: hypothetical protein QOC98_1458 [Frankiaceae bacterium]|nr:hypothetical protein [Frankiaceae bacterium]
MSTATPPAEKLSARSSRRRSARALANPVLVYLASRVVVLVAAGVASLISETAGRPLATGPWPSVPASRFPLVAVLERWDSAWWISLAKDGYPAGLPSGNPLGRFSFFPLYPLLVRGVAATGVPVQYAALLTSTLLGAVAVALLWLFCRDVTDSATADRACALFCFFPGSLVLSMAYSEPVMLVCALGCLLALHRRQWVAAGAAAAVATAARPTAVALCFACAWAAAVAVRRRREWRALIAPVLSPIGALAFFAYLGSRTGHVDAWFISQRDAWHERFDLLSLPHRLWIAARHPVTHSGALHDANHLVALLGTVFIIGALAPLLRAGLPGHVVVYTVVTIVLILGSVTIGARPRLILAAFPLLIPLAARLSDRTFPPVLAASGTLLGAFSVLTLSTLSATP